MRPSPLTGMRSRNGSRVPPDGLRPIQNVVRLSSPVAADMFSSDDATSWRLAHLKGRLVSWSLERGIVRPHVSQKDSAFDLLEREAESGRSPTLPDALRSLDALHAE